MAIVHAYDIFKALLENRPSLNALPSDVKVEDEYYADKNVPLLYFEKFLNNSEEQNHLFIEYAKARSETLLEEIHFNNGRSN